MSSGHLEGDGMDRESPFLEGGMSNEMSMVLQAIKNWRRRRPGNEARWDWWNRWV